MLRYALRRLFQAVPVVILIMVGTFLLLKLAPGDTVDALVGDMGGADAEFIARLRAEYGLDQPVWVQLWKYMAKLATFDFGWSFVYEQPVSTVLLDRLGTTLLLMATSLSLAFTIGTVLGAIAARRAYSLSDNVISTLGLVFYATPSFFLSLMMMLLFSVKLGWLPVGGIETIASFKTGWERVLDIARHLVMPTAALSLIYMSFYLRLMRASVLEVAELDYVRTARAKGAGDWRLVKHHVLRNALLPIVTLLGLQFSTMLGGSVVVESDILTARPRPARLPVGDPAGPEHADGDHLPLFDHRHRGQFPDRSALRPARFADRAAMSVAASEAPADAPGRLVVFWRRYRRNRAALLGLGIFVAVVLMALTAGLVEPDDPLAPGGRAADRAVRRLGDAARHRQARARHRRADLSRRAHLAADRRRRDADRDRDRHRDRRAVAAISAAGSTTC